MFVSTPRGFEGAPATRVLFFLMLVLPIAVSMWGFAHRLNLQIEPFILPWHQFSRLLLNQRAFVDQGSIMLAALIVYCARSIERILGTRRYVLCLVKIEALSTALTSLTLLVLYFSAGVNLNVPAGPMALMGAILSLYCRLIPSVYRFTVTGVGTFSDKVPVYLIAPLIVQTSGQLLVGSIGWLSAYILMRESIAYS